MLKQVGIILYGNALSNYQLCRISYCFQHATSSSILEKLRKQKGAGLSVSHYEDHEEFTSSFNHFRA